MGPMVMAACLEEPYGCGQENEHEGKGNKHVRVSFSHGALV